MKILIVDDGPRGHAAAIAVALCAEDRREAMALNFEIVSAEGGGAPEWIELLPAGQIITGRDGRTWINDNPDLILAAFAADGKDLPIDWEHSTQIRAPNGETSPAAGWIKEMELRDGGLWGRTEWTDKGAASVTSKEYRYLSPVFNFEIESRRIFRMVSCGLTNQPNLYLNALNHQDKENHMLLASLLAALQLPATTTETEALNRVTTLRTDYATALNRADNPPVDRFVPRADYDLALNRATTAETSLKKIQDDTLETAINAEIAAALAVGKITPGTKDYHVAQCKQEGGLARFREYVAAAPVIAGATDLDTKKPDQDTALNAEEQKLCDQMGISVDEYKKANNLK